MLFSNYLFDFNRALEATICTGEQEQKISLSQAKDDFIALLDQIKKKNKAVFVIGNGGSSAIASHLVNDLNNIASVRSYTFHDVALLTCYSNDYGYDAAYANLLNTHITSGDLLVAISSSGQSSNIIKAVQKAKSLEAKTITLTGFSEKNSVRQEGDWNYWIPVNQYGLVEVGHQLICHYWVDSLQALQQQVTSQEGEKKNVDSRFSLSTV